MESNKQQTAVDLLVQQIDNIVELSRSEWKEIDKAIEQAKEMEKQQIESCAIHFTNYAIYCIEEKKEIGGEKYFEQYYEKTFNQ